ncbi:hypothetical protein AURDEDRAFT_168184 [Auricularia subglabra TFB-10046 SS5]|nr:hypothetical protein AURDEDRAFT_168184 [Auricularia subglabra TFB-10046 SS5]
MPRSMFASVSNLPSIFSPTKSSSRKRPAPSRHCTENEPPEGFVMMNDVPSELWSVRAVEIVDELNKEADKRNPDLFNMHVYTDFYSFALYDLIEVKLRDWDKQFKTSPTGFATWHTLEALTLFISTTVLSEGDIGEVDDDERFVAFLRVFSTAVHTLAARLHTSPLPLLRRIRNAANVLRTAAALVDSWCDDLGLEDDERERMPARVRVMLARDGLPYTKKSPIILADRQADINEPKTKRRRGTHDSDGVFIEQLAKLPFREAEQHLRSPDDEEYSWTTVWKAYERTFSAGKRGALAFDITRWPARERAKYELGGGHSMHQLHD